MSSDPTPTPGPVKTIVTVELDLYSDDVDRHRRHRSRHNSASAIDTDEPDWLVVHDIVGTFHYRLTNVVAVIVAAATDTDQLHAEHAHPGLTGDLPGEGQW